MPKLSPIKAKELIKILRREGFEVIRQKGGHAFLENSEGRTTTISIHPGEELGRGLLRKILNDVDLTVEEFDHLRKKRKGK